MRTDFNSGVLFPIDTIHYISCINQNNTSCQHTTEIKEQITATSMKLQFAKKIALTHTSMAVTKRCVKAKEYEIVASENHEEAVLQAHQFPP